MTESNCAALNDRGIIQLKGPDTHKLLQGLITNDIAQLTPEHGLYAGLLTPQGKILFDFLLCVDGDSVLLDIDRSQIANCIKRLTLYRMRSDVSIMDASHETRVFACWGECASSRVTNARAALRDPRHDGLGWRIYADGNFQPEETKRIGNTADYHRHRITLGVPEGGKDYDFGDTFPHEALFDALNGVSFSKGCYVGQEVVSRMEHRGATRKRIILVEGTRALPEAGTEIRAGEVALGKLGSSSDAHGLALIRVDRLSDVRAKNLEAVAEGVALTFSKQPWAGFTL